MSTPTAPHFFITLLHAATQAHVLHLKTDSYAQHKALNVLYDELPELADSLIENYQGIHGIVTNYPTITISPADDAVEFVEALKKYVYDCRDCVGKETQLQNQIDEIVTLIESTLYKLKNLK